MSFCDRSGNASDKIDVCVKHWQPVKYFCKACKEGICAICRVFEHMDHHITDIHSIIGKKTKKQKHATIDTAEHMGNTDIFCTKPNHGWSTVFCAECHGFYCETCLALDQNVDSVCAHTITQIHQMSQHDIGRAQASIEKNICAEHRQPLGHWCKTCSKPICTICHLFKHCNHDVHEISGEMRLATETAECPSTPESILCFKKDHGRATVICMDCNEFYCENCSANHQLYDSVSGHKQRPIGMLSSDDTKRATVRDKHTRCTVLIMICHLTLCVRCVASQFVEHVMSNTFSITEVSHTLQAK